MPRTALAKLPKFTSPPVVEMVLGAQFEPLPGFTTAHVGWYWHEHFGKGWSAQEAARLDDAQEVFGDDRIWSPPVAPFSLRPGHDPNRIQLVKDQRMIQVQNSRFIYNWIKARGTGDYPSYGRLLPEFTERYDQYGAFARGVGLGEISPNHWEVTYVNHVPKGELWSTLEEWGEVIEGFSSPKGGSERLESGRTHWQSVLGGNRARLRVTIDHARLLEATGSEVIKIVLTAKGPVDKKAGTGLLAGLDFGHEAIVRHFAGMTTAKAHAAWGRSS